MSWIIAFVFGAIGFKQFARSGTKTAGLLRLTGLLGFDPLPSLANCL